MVAILTFVDSKWASMMVVLGYLGGKLGFFASFINNLVYIANPAAFWLVDSVV